MNELLHQMVSIYVFKGDFNMKNIFRLSAMVLLTSSVALAASYSGEPRTEAAETARTQRLMDLVSKMNSDEQVNQAMDGIQRVYEFQGVDSSGKKYTFDLRYGDRWVDLIRSTGLNPLEYRLISNNKLIENLEETIPIATFKEMTHNNQGFTIFIKRDPMPDLSPEEKAEYAQYEIQTCLERIKLLREGKNAAGAPSELSKEEQKDKIIDLYTRAVSVSDYIRHMPAGKQAMAKNDLAEIEKLVR